MTQDTNTEKRTLADGVTIERYGLDACMYDEANNPKEETRGHIWRLDVRPDQAGYLERDESLELFVEILDTDQPVEKAAFKRIYAAAEELQALARKIEVAYIQATGDIGTPPTAGDDLLDKYEAEWGEEIVPNVRIKHAPDTRDRDDDGNVIPESFGHYYGLEFNCKEMDEQGGIFTLADTIDDRDAPTINEAAAKRLLAASDQLRDASKALLSTSIPDDHKPAATHQASDAEADLLSALADCIKVEYTGWFHPVHDGTRDAHNFRVTLEVEADVCPFNEFHVSDLEIPLNFAIAERFDRYSQYFDGLSLAFRKWKPAAQQENQREKATAT